jgi:hypothetical protein
LMRISHYLENAGKLLEFLLLFIDDH